ncbi:Ubc6p like ubiquiting conjugating enzyme E2 transmembrane domain at C [Cryptosporidium bovis]|uniref:Ubc6p like ubiquiting conjugating enzyme E2 transmembrane domain at C n=1 Tax=Cryptosporidium bovis TaxID=310047 RepID=UPI00351AA4CF|nr:Ubc6p like ubiquiting conjugating enzyme E2 transmembrane domain at C [Cryptosporidium bovis]
MHQQVTRGVGSSSGIASVQCLSRILREYREIQKEPSSFWCAFPINMDEPFEWHFTIKGPTGTEFEGGMYHGRIILPHSYPFSPPSLMLLTGNGRFEVGKKICLSASNYHPELWQPAWGIRTMLDALHAFFPTPGEGAIHSLDWSPEIRKKLAEESVNWKCSSCNETNLEALSRLCPENNDKQGDSSFKQENPIIQQINKCINESSSPDTKYNQADNSSPDETNNNFCEDLVGNDDGRASSTNGGESVNYISRQDSTPASLYPSLRERETSNNSSNNSGVNQSNTNITKIPPNRLPPKTSQQSIAWSFLLMKKPTSALEGISILIDLLIFILLIAIVLLFIRLIYSFFI